MPAEFSWISGAGKEEAIMLSVASKNVVFNFRELLFAEIIVSALGACMDVGMSIASSLSELKMKKPDMTAKELFKSRKLLYFFNITNWEFRYGISKKNYGLFYRNK